MGRQRTEPEDEYEARRAELLKGLRRQPGDKAGAHANRGDAVANGGGDATDVAGGKKEELVESLGALLERFGDLIAPPE